MRRPGRIAGDDTGLAVVEFALIAPVFLMLLVGMFDVAHTLYMQAALQGAVQKAARDSSLESGSSSQRTAALDGSVRLQMQSVLSGVEPKFSRRFYRSFSEAADAKPEDWNDTNDDGTCNKGERYEDANNNNGWDSDGGNAGQGGAKDATLYTVTIEYDSILPLWKFIGSGKVKSLKATTILRNQPYNDQDSYGAAVWKNCA